MLRAAVFSLLVVAVTCMPKQNDPECLKCKKVAEAGGKLYTSDALLNEALDFFLDTVCDDIPAEYNFTTCREEVTEAWPAIGKGLYDGEEGWFEPSEFCEDLADKQCNFKDDTPAGEIKCSYCEDSLNTAQQYFGWPKVIGDVVYSFQFLGFCSQFHLGEQDCQKKMAWTLPRVMVEMGKLPNAAEKNAQICKDYVKCVA